MCVFISCVCVEQGLTVLHVAALHGRVEVLEALLERGVIEVDVRCPQGRTPLHLALTPKSAPRTQASISCLLMHGAQVNALETTSACVFLHFSNVT